jgi:hypothetical protein
MTFYFNGIVMSVVCTYSICYINNSLYDNNLLLFECCGIFMNTIQVFPKYYMMLFVVCKLCLISFGNLLKQSDTVPVRTTTEK